MSDKNITNEKVDVEANRKDNTGPKLNNLDLSKLKLSQDFASEIAVEKQIITVPVRKPNRQEFVRVHPDDAYAFETIVLELKEEREVYLVDNSLWKDLSHEVVPKIIYTVINRQGTLFLWPIKLPLEDGRHDKWSRSALEGAQIAKYRWLRVQANMNLGAYEMYKASGELSDPEWPDKSFDELVNIAFKDLFINSLEHPVVQRLRGKK
ncbi:MAG: hypothetical protein HOD92_26055 [Deltaproteobacteria bacterium]|jgi:hypothetical protein|nr:hypothetical protein [Deltaproteobacteria bacterium]